MKKFLLLLLLMAPFARADEVVIRTAIGDHVSNLSVKSSLEQFRLTLVVGVVKKREAEIGQKNYDFTVATAKALIAGMKNSTQCPNRDASYLEYSPENGKTTRLDFCFTDQSKENDQLRRLVNTLLMALY